MGRTEKAVGWLSATLVMLIVLAYIIAPRLLSLHLAHRAGKVAVTHAVLTELDISNVDSTAGFTIAFGHREFEVPWTIDTAKTTTKGRFAVVALSSGDSLLISEPKPDGDVASDQKDDATKSVVVAVRSVFGPDAVKSDYDFWKAVYSVQPSNVTFFTPVNRAAALNAILLAKAIAPPTDDSTIYLVNSGQYKGFQFGDPSHHPKRMDLALYGQPGAVELIFFLKGDQLAHTQAEFNRIIRTMTYVKDEQTSLLLTSNDKK
jgi:hypothetical protein